MKILVAIANYGIKNEAYLGRLLTEYRRMPFDVDFIVLSNIPKQLGEDVEVKIGLPDKNPWSLPFGHKRIFADRASQYDLFIYTEDDTLITERNIRAFLKATEVLPGDKVAGFLRYETSPAGVRHISSAHAHFHWLPESVETISDQHFARFTNDHSACYILVREQLKKVLASGGFLTEPYEAEYDMLCSAATDPYTRCGLTKVINLSQIDDFLLPHLPNKYIGLLGTELTAFQTQIAALKEIAQNKRPASYAIPDICRRHDGFRSLNLYEPVCQEVIRLVPPGAKKVLSLGVGLGKTECELSRLGFEVTVVPFNSVICAYAEQKGVRTILSDLDSACEQLGNEKFDFLIIRNLLHLHQNPANLLQTYAKFLSDEGSLLLMEPNFANVQTSIRRLLGTWRASRITTCKGSITHTSVRRIRRWLRSAGLEVKMLKHVSNPEPSRREQLLDSFPLCLRSIWLNIVAGPKSVVPIPLALGFA